MHETSFDVVCPGCRGPLEWRAGAAVCRAERIEFPVRDGVPYLVVPASRERVARFLERYLAVRRDERWTDDDRELLTALPYRDLSNRHAAMWRTRARGLEALRRALRRRFGARRLRVCERGAGVAWLSYRLALDGHDVLATDVNTDPADGLGAARHYAESGVARVAAEMDRLPLADGSVDVVVNAASFHYAATPEAQAAAAAEAARVLAPGGLLAIVDSPVYGSRASGERMLAEWSERLAARYGARAGEARDSGYLVRAELVETLSRAGLSPSLERHWMGWGWEANFWRHLLLGPREPATLPLVLGQKTGRSPVGTRPK